MAEVVNNETGKRQNDGWNATVEAAAGLVS
jgi:hypothetical protein